MSHLSILPTLVDDLELLASALRAEDFAVEAEGVLRSFGTHHPVALAATHSAGFALGWIWNRNHESFDVVVDLGKASSAMPLERILNRILRRYALQQALRDAEQQNLVVNAVDDQSTSRTPASIRG